MGQEMSRTALAHLAYAGLVGVTAAAVWGALVRRIRRIIATRKGAEREASETDM